MITPEQIAAAVTILVCEAQPVLRERTLAYVPGGDESASLVVVDRAGKVQTSKENRGFLQGLASRPTAGGSPLPSPSMESENQVEDRIHHDELTVDP